jgi:hypothetical protein
MDGGRWWQWREESSGVKSLSVTVGGQEASRQGVVEERARHSGVDEGDEAKKGNGGGRRLLWRPEGAAQREGADGVRGLAPRGGENGEERGGGQRGTARAAGIGPRLVGVGGAIAARQRREAGCERRGRERLSCGTGRRRRPVAVMGCGRE